MPPTAHFNPRAERRFIALAIALGIAGSWWAAACHDFRACYDEPCEPVAQGGSDASAEPIAGADSDFGGQAGNRSEPDPGGASFGGDGGAAGAAGAAGDGPVTFSCAPPAADCDESKLTGCEANLLMDVEHCGGCRQRCYGVCVEGVCSPFELLSLQVDAPRTNGVVPFGPGVLVTSLSDPPLLLRWSTDRGAETVDGGPWDFDALVGASDRVYLLGGASSVLSSLLLKDSSVVSENTTAATAAVIADTLYAVDRAGMPYKRTASPPTRTNLPLPVARREFDQPLMATDGSELALVVNHSTDPDTYSAFFLVGSAWQLADSGSEGEITQVKVLGTSMYVAVRPDVPGDELDVEYAIMRIDADGGKELIHRALGVVSFELSGNLYVSRASGYRRGRFLVIPLDDPSKSQELETTGDMLSLTYISPYFYFGLSHRTAFGRVRSWLE